MAFANLKKLLNSLFFQPALDGVEIVTRQMLLNKMLEYDTGMVTSQWGYFRSLNTKFDVNTCTSYFQWWCTPVVVRRDHRHVKNYQIFSSWVVSRLYTKEVVRILY